MKWRGVGLVVIAGCVALVGCSVDPGPGPSGGAEATASASATPTDSPSADSPTSPAPTSPDPSSLAPTPAVSASTVPACADETGWTTDPVSAPELTAASVTGVSVVSERCYDTFTAELNGPVAGYTVEYVDELTGIGSGFPIALEGAAVLRVIVGAPSYDSSTGESTYEPADPDNVIDVSATATIGQIAFAGSFESQSWWGLGLDEQLPFRVRVEQANGDAQNLVVEIRRDSVLAPG